MSSGQWRTEEVDGKLVDIFEPTHSSGFGVLHLHGHGLKTLIDSPVFTAELEQRGLTCLCPHGQRSWWLDLVCEEFDSELSPQAYLLESIVPYFAGTYDIEPPAIGLTGISMGGQGILQLAFRHARQFPVVAAISPAIDFHQLYGLGLPLDELFPNAEEARQATAILQVHPLNWPRHMLFVCDPTDSDWIDGVHRLVMKLSSSGIPSESDLETIHGGHDWSYFEHMAPQVMSFVSDRLEQASRALA